MTDQERLIKEQEKFYKAANFLLAPARFAVDMFEFTILVAILLGIGLFYPVILMCNHQPVSGFAFAVSGLTILTIITFIYTPYYFIFGGLITAAAFIYGICAYPDFMTACHFDTATYCAWLLFAFLAVGIVQKAIRESITPPPPSVLALRKKVKMAKKVKKQSPVQTWRMSSAKPITWKKPPTQ